MSIPSWVNLPEWIRSLLSPLVAMTTALATGLLLWGNESVLTSIGLATVADSHRELIGVAFLISVAFLVASGLKVTLQQALAVVSGLQRIRAGRKYLCDLTPSEREHLHKYVGGRTKSVYFHLADGVVHKLAEKGIVEQAADADRGGCYSFLIADWAWEHLTEHPELVDPERALDSGELHSADVDNGPDR